MNNDDEYKSDSDYIDLVQEEKKEIKNEITKTIIKFVVMIVVVVLVCFLGYKGIMLGIDKIQETGILEDDNNPNQYYQDSGDSGSGPSGGTMIDDDGETVVAPSGCYGVFGGVINKEEVDYILYDDGSYSATIGNDAEVGTFTHDNDKITFDVQGSKETVKTDSKCSFLEIDGVRLTKR